MSCKKVTISLENKYIRKIEIIAKMEYTDRSKLIRKWIDANFKEEYQEELEENE